MAVSGSALRGLREEASCPVCLDFLREPLMLTGCGHNFCQDCLSRCCQWQGRQGQGPSRCPQCREPFLPEQLRPNLQLASLVNVARRLALEGGGGGRECLQHGEPLKLFCREDQTLICLVCRESRDHQRHQALPTEEAAQQYKLRIQSRIDILRKQKEKALESKWRGKQESQSLLKQTNIEKQRLITEFRNMHLLMEEKEGVLLASLEELDKKIRKRKDEQEAKLSEECSSLDKLVQEMEEKCQQPAWEFLQDIGTHLERCEAGVLQKSVGSSSELKHKIKEFADINPFLQHIMKQFKDSLHAEFLLCKENVTLDPVTAHPGLSLSKDQRSVRLGNTPQELPSTPERFDTESCVLGQKGFSSGNRWWEVEVEERGVWAVGVARMSVERKGRIGFNPEEGIWAVGQFLGGHYLALTNPKHILLLNQKLKKIRVHLDYEKEQVKFLDADTDSPIYTFTQALFKGERVLPWFWVGGLASHLRLSL